MSSASGNNEAPTGLAVKIRRSRPSRMDPAALAAAARADQIPIGRKWRPGLALLLVVAASAAFWAVIAALVARAN